MNETFSFLIDPGYTVLFVWIFAEQVGLPLPATLLLPSAGALAGQGQRLVLFRVGEYTQALELERTRLWSR